MAAPYEPHVPPSPPPPPAYNPAPPYPAWPSYPQAGYVPYPYPGYAPLAFAPYPYPGYAPYPARARRTMKPIVATLFWVVLLLRNIGFVFILSILWMESGGRPFPPGGFISPITEPVTLVLIVLVGLAATITALVCDVSRTRHLVGTVAGAIALAASVTPGIAMGFGLFGIGLSTTALLLHLVSKAEFAPPKGADPYPPYAPA